MSSFFTPANRRPEHSQEITEATEVLRLFFSASSARQPRMNTNAHEWRKGWPKRKEFASIRVHSRLCSFAVVGRHGRRHWRGSSWSTRNSRPSLLLYKLRGHVAENQRVVILTRLICNN